MDVSAIASGTGTPAPAGIENGAAPATTQTGAQPAAQGQPAAPSAPANNAGLSPAIAKLFGAGAIPEQTSLSVSYRVVKDLDEIVTVFTDPKTGREVAQVPAEMLIGLAQFFEQERGATLDANA